MGQIKKKCSVLIPFFLTGEIKNLFYKIEQDSNITYFKSQEEFSTIFYKIKFMICGEEDVVNKYIKEIKQLEFGNKEV